MALRDSFYLRVGDLKERISIRSRPTTRGANGEIDNSYESTPNWPVFIEKCWCAVSPMSGLDLVRAEREVSRALANFYIIFRKSAVPTNSMRIIWTPAGQTVARYFDIQNVNVQEYERQMVELYAAEVG